MKTCNVLNCIVHNSNLAIYHLDITKCRWQKLWMFSRFSPHLSSFNLHPTLR